MLSALNFFISKLAGLAAVGIWIASLTQLVTWSCTSGSPYPGYRVLMFGWLGPIEGQFGWFANLFMLWTIGRLVVQGRAGLSAASFGLLLALSRFAWTKQVGDNGADNLCGHGWGFYLWLTCAVFLFAVALLEWGSEPRTTY